MPQYIDFRLAAPLELLQGGQQMPPVRRDVGHEGRSRLPDPLQVVLQLIEERHGQSR
ncbi:hypothetical protein SCE1572_13435 [Sorangium cellulosum So0157-2]|uniref:Uncharacterized protein n=1 Tax=Sorangium cellulosum So0157-2 TaxID=1254432 RepID=S4XSF6_SORCE|nr:hypothetical protein SCE1572_13435 [Sorangium cellulosum So0157-2]